MLVAPNPVVTQELQSNTPVRPKASTGRFPSLPHKARFRGLSGKFTVYPVLQHGPPENASLEGIPGPAGEPVQGTLPMGLSEDAICRTDDGSPLDRAVRGFNGLPKKGKELLEDGTIRLYQLSKQQHFKEVFWTVTLPSHYLDGTPFIKADYERFLRNWPEFRRRVMEELSRLLERKGLPNRWLYVIEPQEDRWREQGILAPHIHAVIPNRWNPQKRNPDKDKGFENSGYWELTTDDLDDAIARCAARVMGRPVDCRASGNVQSINHLGQLAQYLAKFNKLGSYFSKGSKVMKDIQDSEWSHLIPSNWYGADKETRREVRASVMTMELGTGSLAQANQALEELNAQYEADEGRPLFTGIHTHWINPDGSPVAHNEPLPPQAFPVAMTGRVSRFMDIELGLGLLEVLDLNQIPIELDD